MQTNYWKTVVIKAVCWREVRQLWMVSGKNWEPRKRPIKIKKETYICEWTKTIRVKKQLELCKNKKQYASVLHTVLKVNSLKCYLNIKVKARKLCSWFCVKNKK